MREVGVTELCYELLAVNSTALSGTFLSIKLSIQYNNEQSCHVHNKF